MNERGAILPSIIVFVFLLLVLLSGSAKIYQDQVHQLVVTKESYKARTMLALTEQEILTHIEGDRSVDTGAAVFDVGTVTIKKLSENRYQLIAVTDSQFSIQKEVVYTIPESEIETEETNQRRPTEKE